MSTKTIVSSPLSIVSRRGELMAELFLQELQPVFVAQPVTDIGYDFFIGFTNSEGGLNTYAVEVKATQHPVNEKYRMPGDQFRRLVSSNLPVLLLVAEVKQNHLYYAWPHEHKNLIRSGASVVTIPVTEINLEFSAKLRAELVMSRQGQAKAA
jgi:hypothetical protein